MNVPVVLKMQSLTFCSDTFSTAHSFQLRIILDTNGAIIFVPHLRIFCYDSIMKVIISSKLNI